MATYVYFGKFGILRLQSGTSDGIGGVYYFQAAFEQMDLSVVGGRPRPDEILVLDRGVLNAYAHHIQGSDAAILQAQQVTFTCMLDNTINRFNLRRALGNPDRESPWSVGGQTWTNVNGTTYVYNGAGSLVSCPLPYDVLQDRINMQVLWYGNPAQDGSQDLGMSMKEVWFQPANLRVTEAADSVKLAVTGSIYGMISAISAFTAGTDVSR